MPDAVLFQTDGPVCTILLNRPECRNAVDGPTAAAWERNGRGSSFGRFVNNEIG